jgi:hypothetical protein
MSEHQHTWSFRAHLDGCHIASWAYSCPCGATRATGHERDFQDPHDMSYAHWFEETCERCNELADGAEPKEWDEIEEGRR